MDKQDIKIYIGLSDAQLSVISSIGYDLDRAPKNVRAALIARKLYTENGKLTSLGSSVLRMYTDLKAGKFEALPAILPDKDLKVMDNLFDITGQKAPRELRLQSVHFKFLRILMRHPGISIFHMESIFALFVFSDLISRGLARREPDSHQIFPTEAGIQLITGCILTARASRQAAEAKKKGSNNG